MSLQSDPVQRGLLNSHGLYSVRTPSHGLEAQHAKPALVAESARAYVKLQCEVLHNQMLLCF